MNMGNLNKLALTAQEALQQTIVIASENEASQAEPIHMLKALLESQENNLSAIIKRIGADPFQLRANVDAEIERMPKVSGNSMMMAGAPGPALMNLIDNAVKIAEKLGDSYATSEHLLIALSEDKGAAGKVLWRGRRDAQEHRGGLRVSCAGDTRVTDPQEKAQFEALEQYGQKPHPAGARRQAGPGDRPCRGNPPHHSGAFASHEEQPRAHRRAGHPARRPSWRGWRSASWPATSPRRSRTATSCRWTWAP